MAKREVKTTLYLEDKSFVNGDGVSVAYTDVSVELAGKRIGLSVKTRDKGLLDYLVAQLGNEVK